MKWLNNILNSIATTGRVVSNELSVIFHDAGAMIFFFGLPLLYPIVYTLIYNPEVVNKISVTVIDDSRSAESRQLVQVASASPGIDIYSYSANLNDARQLMNEHKVYGILHIPADYAHKINTGEQAHIPFYVNMELLLRYRTFVASMTNLQLKMASDIAETRIDAIGAESLGAGQPVESNAYFLGDTEQGFASFVIPGIIILIIQQSMLLGIALIEGSSNERRRLNAGRDPKMIWWANPVQNVLGKASAYVMIYLPVTLYVLCFIPWMFHLPQYGDLWQCLLFALPLLIASAMLGLALGPIMRERENGFTVLVVTSVLFLFLSGLTWPRYAMSSFWVGLGDLIPAVWGIEGFIRMNSNAASLAENSHPYMMMWVLAALYAVIAVATGYYKRYRQDRCRTVARH